MSYPRIECRDCHHALKLSGTVYVHSGARGADCQCSCQNAPLENITYFIPKHMRKHIPPEMIPDAWKSGVGASHAGDAARDDAGTGGGDDGVQAGDGSTARPAEGLGPVPIGVDAGSGGADGGVVLDPSVRWFSNSELACFRRCKRKWWFAFYKQLKLRYEDPSGVRGLGTRLHEALAAWYSPGNQDPMQTLLAGFAEDRAKLEAMALIPDVPLDVSDRLLELKKDEEYGVAMLEGYFLWLRETGSDEGLRILSAEERIAVPAGIPGTGLAAKMDVRVLREQDKARLFVDHKSVGNFTEPAKTLHLDTQMLHYGLIELLTFLQLGMEPPEIEATKTDGGLYNMLRRVKRTAAANPPFYQRLEIRHSIKELRSYYVRVHGEIQDILDVERKLNEGSDPRYVAYPTPKRDCSWDCDFLPVCPMVDDGSRLEDMLAAYYEPHDVLERYRDAKEVT